MAAFELFCDKLNESPWMGAVCEVGIGLPFQSAYVNHPGASRTILFTHGPYNKAFQPNDIGRSVSHEMAARYAWDNYWKCLKNERVQNNYLFSVAVSAAHKVTGERGQSHGWVSVVACEEDDSEPKAYSFHWRVDKSLDRQSAGEVVAENIAWFLQKILLNKWDNWEDAIKDKASLLNIDVIRAPDITMEEHLLLAKKDVPLLYHRGEFKRPVDYIRRYGWCYRGSFNPVTISHESNGKSSLFELSIDNARKGKVSFSQLSHRIGMIDLIERPTLITAGVPLFVDLHKLLMKLDAGSMEYLLGADTFNAVVNKDYIDKGNELFFLDFEKDSVIQSGRFLVIPREGCKITSNKYSDAVCWREVESEHPTVSSTAVREGDLTLVSDKVKKYIESHDLYGKS